MRILSVSEGLCVDQISYRAAAQGRSSGRVGGLPLLVLSRKNIIKTYELQNDYHYLLENPLDCKDMKPVNAKGNQP